MGYQIKPFSRKEHHFYVDLILLRNTMISNAEAVRDRLKPFKGAYRDLCLMQRLAEKIQNDLSQTIPADKLARFQELVRHGRYTLDFPGPAPRKEYKLMDTKELSCIAEEAIKGKCMLCMLEGKEVRKCPLRNALLSVAPPSQVSDIGCEYREVAGDLEFGREVRL